MATQSLPYVTPEQYLEFDRNSEFQNEYIHGEIVPMTGGSPRHARIIANAIGELHSRFSEGPCGVFSSALRVAVNPKIGYVYPDVTVVCGELEYVDAREDTVTNPKVVVEVLSSTTRNYDLGDKARLYWETPSLTNLVFIEQERIWIEHWHRATDIEWKKTVLKDAAGILNIESLNCQIPVGRLYLGAELPAAGE
jgi:Uma2 family endonuclease